MTDPEKIADLLLDSAWRSLEFVQERNDKIEEKANNLMAFSGILITVNAALIMEFIKSVFITVLLSIEMGLLIICVWYAYCTIKLRKHGVLDMVGTVKAIDLTNHIQSTGDLAVTIANRQQELLYIVIDRSLNLKKSMKWLALALGFVFVIILIYVLGELAPSFQILLQQWSLSL
ncbi:Uncharacterised protein [uncultured archaeon]|nr:Uncharacterised protein [uncultured archaeon]